MNSATEVWKRVLDILRGELTSTAIDTWFNDTEAVDISENRLILCCPSDFKKVVIEGRFLQPIEDALREIFSGSFGLDILSAEERDAYLKNVDGQKHRTTIENDDLTFEKFVVGNSNKFAHAAAMAVAEKPADTYNPLFIYGESGLGKTHLLYAIYHAVKKRHPEFQIVYIKGDEFANELISAIQTGDNVKFREKYRSADLFLVDDIQFIAGKVQTQEEFFHTFNTLYEAKRQIVMTSDRPPMEIMRLEDRLKSRFEWGLLADIQPPNYETRVAIVKNKSKQLCLNMPDSVAAFIADNITANVRQLEGTVKKLTAYRDLLNDNIDIDAVTRAIRDIFKEKTEYLPTPDIIIQETASFHGLTPTDIKGRGRTRGTATARQISMYLIRKLTNLTLDEIGNQYDGRYGKGMDHSTVLSSIRKVEDQLEHDQFFSDTVRDISANISSRG